MSEVKVNDDTVTFSSVEGSTIEVSAKTISVICRISMSETYLDCAKEGQSSLSFLTREPFNVVISKLALAGTPAVSLSADTAPENDARNAIGHADGTIHQPIHSLDGCRIGCTSSVGSLGSFKQDKPYVHGGNLSEEELGEWLRTLTHALSKKLSAQDMLDHLTKEFADDVAKYTDDTHEAEKVIADYFPFKNLFVYSPNNENKEQGTKEIRPFSEIINKELPKNIDLISEVDKYLSSLFTKACAALKKDTEEAQAQHEFQLQRLHSRMDDLNKNPSTQG